MWRELTSALTVAFLAFSLFAWTYPFPSQYPETISGQMCLFRDAFLTLWDVVSPFFTSKPYCDVLWMLSAVWWASTPTPPLCACGRQTFADPFPYAYVCPPTDYRVGYSGFDYCRACSAPKSKAFSEKDDEASGVTAVFKTNLKESVEKDDKDKEHGATGYMGVVLDLESEKPGVQAHSEEEKEKGVQAECDRACELLFYRWFLDVFKLDLKGSAEKNSEHGATGYAGIGLDPESEKPGVHLEEEEEEGIPTRGQDESDRAYELRFYKWFLKGASAEYKQRKLESIAMHREYAGNNAHVNALEKLVLDSLQEKKPKNE